MATTANYGWTTPDDTDLVKDGASAIRTLGSAIDTTTKANADLVGCVHIETQTFSAVSSISFNDVFSATYDNYKIICNATGTSGAGINVRLRVAGTDNSASEYRRQVLTASSTSISGSRSVNDSSWLAGLGLQSSTNPNLSILELQNPFQTQYTAGRSFSQNDTNGNVSLRDTALGISVNTSYTGFTAIASASTITGLISVYGYAKA